MDLVNIELSDLFEGNRIIVDLQDNLCKKYCAVIMKTDKNNNILVRYFDNPPNNYYWTGNRNGKYGLNPSIYHCKAYGDDYDEMEGLNEEDFAEDGYDDIFEYSKDKGRLYKMVQFNPYFGGNLGNVECYKYYVNKYKTELMNGDIPECIRVNCANLLGDSMRNNLRRIRCNSLIENIIACLPVNYNPLVRNYHLNGYISPEELCDLKKIFSRDLNYQIIKTINNDTSITIAEIYNIKDYLQAGKNHPFLINILPYIIKRNIRVFQCLDNDIEINDYVADIDADYILLIAYNNNAFDSII